MSFTSKQLTQPDRVCLRLAEARNAAGISIHDMKNRLRVSQDIIEALESCNFDMLPGSTMYHKKLIRAYCKAIDADATPYIHQFTIEETTQETAISLPRRHKLHSFGPLMPTICKISAFVTTIALVLTYLGIQVLHIVEPPELSVHGPHDGFVSTDGRVTIEGIADAESQIDINGKHIMNTEEGHFSENIILAEGVNTIVVSAKKKHGKPTTFTRHVMYKKQGQLSLEETPDTGDTL